ncbi:MAG: SAM hydrolase/SAM-dependent halogenase family protein [Solirubrobacterales bacterium]
MAAAPITFLSDYGYDDEFAGVCRAVIARIAPDAPLIDLTHGIPRHAVAQGALVLARSLPFTPAGVHLAVVDPGVGTDRRGVAVAVGEEGRILVGPDNGLLAAAAERLGGARDAVDISLSPLRLDPVSATFHGRDLFAPVAAHLAAGAALADAGEAVDPVSLVASPLAVAAFDERGVTAHVVGVDRFGNAGLDLGHEDLPRTGLRLGRPLCVITGGEEHRAGYALTFADVAPGKLILYENSWRALGLAVNRGSAAELLHLEPGSEVRLEAE